MRTFQRIFILYAIGHALFVPTLLHFSTHNNVYIDDDGKERGRTYKVAVGFAYIIAKRVRKAGVLTSAIRDGASGARARARVKRLA